MTKLSQPEIDRINQETAELNQEIQALSKIPIKEMTREQAQRLSEAVRESSQKLKAILSELKSSREI